MATELLTNPKVGAAVDAAILERSERTRVKQDRVVHELARLGFSDVRKLFNKSGDLLPVNEWSDDAAAAVASVEVVTAIDSDKTPIYVKKVKVWDKNKALELLGRHLAMFVERKEVTGLGGGPIQHEHFTTEQVRRMAEEIVLAADEPALLERGEPPP